MDGDFESSKVFQAKEHLNTGQLIEISHRQVVLSDMNVGDFSSVLFSHVPRAQRLDVAIPLAFPDLKKGQPLERRSVFLGVDGGVEVVNSTATTITTT